MVLSSRHTEATDAPDQPRPRGRFRIAGRVLRTSVSVGLVAGLLAGWVHVVSAARGCLPMMGWWEWVDALTFSGLAHLAIWTAQGLVLAVPAAVLVVLSSQVRHSLHPGALAAAVFTAGVTTVSFWAWAIEARVDEAMRVTPGWWILLATVWLTVGVTAYVLAWAISATHLARLSAGFVRRMTLPAILLGVVCLAVQWFSRGQPRGDAPTWPPTDAAPSAETSSPPNVVLIILDTQRADRLGCYGYDRKTSPRLDAFAADAVVFDRCISPAVWTLPSHTSMFTGLYPSEHGATWDHLWVDNQFTTLPQILEQAGYQTMALSNNPYVGGTTNLARGFHGFLHPIMLNSVRMNVFGTITNGSLYPSRLVGTWVGQLMAQDDGAEATNRLANRFLDRRDPNKPFFLFVNYMEPHAPYIPHMPYKRRYVDPDLIDMSFRCVWWLRRPEYSLLKRDVFAPEQMTLLNDCYDAETRQLDDYVGGLLERLARRVDLDRTLIIITSDHGENLGEHHIIGHAWCVAETLSHVPMIVRYPRRIEPGRRTQLVQTLDVHATVLDAVQGSPPKEAHWSRSLLATATAAPSSRPASPTTTAKGSATTAAATASRPATSSSPTTAPADRLIITEYLAGHDAMLDAAQKLDNRFDRTPHERPVRGIRQGPWKLVMRAADDRALHNLDDDPAETTNLLDDNPDVARRLTERLDVWRRSITPYRSEQTLEGGRQMDPSLQSRLRDLGYVQ